MTDENKLIIFPYSREVLAIALSKPRWDVFTVDSLATTFVLTDKDQHDFVSWIWKHKPELLAEILCRRKEIFELYMNAEADEQQRWFLNWIKTHKPELLKEILG